MDTSDIAVIIICVVVVVFAFLYCLIRKAEEKRLNKNVLNNKENSKNTTPTQQKFNVNTNIAEDKIKKESSENSIPQKSSNRLNYNFEEIYEHLNKNFSGEYHQFSIEVVSFIISSSLSFPTEKDVSKEETVFLKFESCVILYYILLCYIKTYFESEDFWEIKQTLSKNFYLGMNFAFQSTKLDKSCFPHYIAKRISYYTIATRYQKIIEEKLNFICKEFTNIISNDLNEDTIATYSNDTPLTLCGITIMLKRESYIRNLSRLFVDSLMELFRDLKII